MINFVDDQIGRLWQFIAAADRANTMFVVISDHGEMLGDHHMYRKTYPYESSARIPFLVKAPATWNLPSEMVCTSPVGLQDVMPTILSAAGLPIPAGCTGHDLMPVVRGETDRVREALHGEHAGCYAAEDGMHFLTTDRMKYIWYSETGLERLFDLEADPREEHDLALAAGSRSPAELDKLLGPWREQLVQVLTGWPEGFVAADGATLQMAAHTTMLPGYDPHKPFAMFL